MIKCIMIKSVKTEGKNELRKSKERFEKDWYSLGKDGSEINTVINTAWI